MKYVIKQEIQLKECLNNTKTLLRSHQCFRCEEYNLLTKEVHKISLSVNNDKRMQTPAGEIT